MTEPQSDSEILHMVAIHPRIDLLRLLAESDHYPHQLTKELGLDFKNCYSHMKVLDDLGLLGRKWPKYCITDKGRQILSKLNMIKEEEEEKTQ
ncbi:MAG: winged helix-turn-helix domain-containing protein [Candidatus Nitrosopolaris sp.]